jgi:hypothetical protein
MAEPLDYDPPAQSREWFRHARDGQLGWKVRRDGRDCIKLDRVAQEIIQPFRDGDWIAEVEHRPLNKWQIFKVAFEADKELCRVLGLIHESKREWLNLRDEERQDWMDWGPEGKRPEDAIRNRFWKAIIKQLAPLAV